MGADDGLFYRIDDLDCSKRRHRLAWIYYPDFYGSCHSIGGNFRDSFHIAHVVYVLPYGIYHRKHTHYSAENQEPMSVGILYLTGPDGKSLKTEVCTSKLFVPFVYKNSFRNFCSPPPTLRLRQIHYGANVRIFFPAVPLPGAAMLFDAAAQARL